MNTAVKRLPLFFLLLVLLVSSFGAAGVTSAEVGCGKITAPGYFFDVLFGNETIQDEAITNCSNPFNEDAAPPSPYTLKVEGSEVAPLGVTYIPVGGTENIVVEGISYNEISSSYLFLHTETDYLYINRNAPEITVAQYQDYVSVHFSNPADIALYKEINTAYFEGSTYSYFYDEEGMARLDSSNLQVEGRFFSFLETAGVALTPSVPKVQAGTYTMVIKESALILGFNSWWQNLQNLFINTAYAEEIPTALTYTITFTLVEGEEPSGASSVLFLPGIMGSRLFEESEECNLFGGADKVERWFSNLDCDIERLMMDESGQSINNIFSELEGGVIDEIVGVNLYKSFINDLDNWKEEGQIADYKTIPYDWRLRLQDILRLKNASSRTTLDKAETYQGGYLYQNLQALKDASSSGKVVLVGHSNGGLVIQALLAIMKVNNDPLLPAIEKVILVAVPQTGTPESVVGLLHGTEIGFLGAVVPQEISRTLMNKAPFAYHLLPSEDYYNEVATPVIKIEAGTSTNPWRTQFGSELDSYEEVTAFLRKESGRETPKRDDLLTPATTYNSLHQYANVTQTSLSNWRPTNTKVYQIAGTGIETPIGITYFTDTECVQNVRNLFGITCIEYAPKLGYRVDEIIDGDGTVVAPSALATQSGEGVEEWWMDLLSSAPLFGLSIKHKDILEQEEVRGLVLNIITSSTPSSFTYLKDHAPDLPSKDRIVYRLHSPLDLYVVLSDGEVVGSSTPELRGVEYHRYGEVQSLSIPRDEEDYEIRLSGLAIGSFTFEVDEYSGNTLDERTTYSAVPSGTSTEVIFKVEDTDQLNEASLLLDYEGDGVFEAVIAAGLGQITYLTQATTTTSVVKSSSSGTRVKDRIIPNAPLGGIVSANVVVTEKDLLLQLIQLLTQYRDLLIKLKVQ